MKLLHTSFFIFCIFTFTNCNNTDDELMTTVLPPLEETLEEETIEECVLTEDITSEVTGFLNYHKGLQEEGVAKGIKINEEWGGSAFYRDNHSIPRLVVNTYWHGLIGGFDYEGYSLAELLTIVFDSYDISNKCYELTNQETNLEEDKIQCNYSLHHGDTTLDRYQLKEEAINVLEVLEHDREIGVFRCKLNASFITDKSLGLPEYPEELRLFNVEIEIGI